MTHRFRGDTAGIYPRYLPCSPLISSQRGIYSRGSTVKITVDKHRSERFRDDQTQLQGQSGRPGMPRATLFLPGRLGIRINQLHKADLRAHVLAHLAQLILIEDGPGRDNDEELRARVLT